LQVNPQIQESSMQIRIALLGTMLCLCLAPILWAQDAVKVDPKHYSVVTENDQVRVLKVHYGPHEKSIMHSHPDSVAVSLTTGKVQFTLPDGKTQVVDFKSGDSQFTPAGTHLPENISDHAMDIVLVELKGKH